jgi:class 3 adenylate cyclase/ActR/RegA family two-component response regulator
MVARPEGEVTLLFTDVEGSTGLVEKLGPAYAELLTRKRALIRAAILATRGFEVDCRGDEFFVSFAKPERAIAAAVSAQHALAGSEWPQGARVRVRMGIHTGRPALDGESDYVGIDVHRAARICSAGHGGQILLSGATRSVLPSVETVDLGEHELPGLPVPERLFQLVAPGLDQTFPPLRAAQSKTGGTRVAIADDSVLLREGIARLLEDAGFHVVGQAGTAEDLLSDVRAHEPHVAIVDIRMPPTNTDEGLRAAKVIRDEFPGVGVLVLSSHIEEEYARELLENGATGVGYMLKDRVGEVEEFTEAVRRIAAGEVVLDPSLR